MRTALVTGGASGIGRAVAAALVERGDHVVVADVDAAGAERAAAELHGGPGSAHAVALDVTDRDAFVAVVADVVRDAGGLDLLVNNAGVGVGGPVEEMTPAHWDRAFDVNVRGVVHGVEAAYPVMVRQRRGHIVNTGSVAGLMPAPLMVPYSASKHAVVGLSRALRLEAAAHGVGVTALCPGFVATPLLDDVNPALPGTDADREAPRYVQRLQGRMATPGEVAVACLRGVERNRAVVVVPRMARLAVLGERLLPRLVAAVSRAEIARYRAECRRRSP